MRLPERIVIERETQLADGAGGFTSSWAPLATRWANAKAVRGSESEESGRTQSRQTWLFTVRRDSTTETVTASDRISWDDAIYNIRNVRRGLPNGIPHRGWCVIEAETA